jgi:hypothetical protein
MNVCVLYYSRSVMIIKERGRVWGFFSVLSPLRKVRKFSNLIEGFSVVFKRLNREFSIPRHVRL